MQTIQLATDVLVVGGGQTGLKAADEIARQGYNVILAHAGSDITALGDPLWCADRAGTCEQMAATVRENDRIEIISGARLEKVAGVTGDFSVTLSVDGKQVGKRVGAIVLSTDFARHSLEQAYGLDLTDNVVSQSQLEDLAAAGDLSGKLGTDADVAFVLGFGQQGTPLLMERTLRNIAQVKDAGAGNVYVFIGDVKLAADGLDRLYARAREQGVIYFKSVEPPRTTQSGKDVTVRLMDPVLRREVELAPDLLVVEEAISADPANEVLSQILRIDRDAAGFLQPDNVHFFPVATNREGIFVVGAARDFENLPAGWTDAENAAAAVAELLGDGTIEVLANQARVDVDKCTICLTCYRCCPHGAIYWDSRAIISPVACQACGICASECPMEAIQIGEFEDAAMASKLDEAMGQPKNGPAIVAFCCRNSGVEAGRAAEAFRMEVPPGVRTIEVPCAGKVDIDYIMDAFVKGADGVCVLTCHAGNCKSEKGNTYAGWRVKEVQRMLEEIGLEKERVVFATIAANMAGEFSRITREMEDRIKAMG